MVKERLTYLAAHRERYGAGVENGNERWLCLSGNTEGTFAHHCRRCCGHMIATNEEIMREKSEGA